MKLDFCVACGTRENLHHHHLIPRSRGGNDIESNLITVCQHHHSLIHNFTWRGNLSDLIKAGLQRAKKKGVRVHGTKEEMDKLHEIKRKEYLKFCLSLLPYIVPGITRKEQADIFEEKKFKRFRNYRGMTGRWDDHGVLKVIRCLQRNGKI